MAEEKNIMETSKKHIEKGAVIFEKGNVVDSICVVIKGRVMIQNDFTRSVVGTGSFLGLFDLFAGIYQVNYVAVDNLVVMMIPVSSVEDLKDICDKYFGYAGLMVSYMSRRINNLYSIYQSLHDEVISMRDFIVDTYEKYKESCIENSLEISPIIGMDSFSEIGRLPLQYKDGLEYYSACVQIPVDVQKQFYSSDSIIYMHHLEEQQHLISNIYGECVTLAEENRKNARVLILNSNCLFSVIVELANRLKSFGNEDNAWISYIDQVIEKINILDELYSTKMGLELGVDRDKMEKAYMSLILGDDFDVPAQVIDTEKPSLNNSLERILEYSEVDEEISDAFTKAIESFINTKDKFSKESDMSHLRSDISKLFYQIYGTVFRKAVSDENVPYVVDLFLKYGFVSERLLSEEQLDELTKLKETPAPPNPCNVYTLFDWLKLIYSGEKEPSKNEFDLDYEANIRYLIKTGEITQEEAIDLKINMDRKLQYELDNLVRVTNRLLSPQISTFVPILFKEGCSMSLLNTHLTPYKLNSAVKKIVEVDFSAFSRETMFSDEKAGIVKDYIMVETYPDIIVFPCYGNKGIMWQEITGRKRNTPGRFIFPIFMENDEVSAMLTVIGGFRWELCKTIQGVKWNDFSIKSLTSEYCDYIQFYRKNNSLSDEWKEKVKQQIKNSRNKIKEIFIKDYIEWIKRESEGGIRLNKVSREILATYVPFRAELREKVSKQPIFADAMKRYNILSNKKIREYDNKCVYFERAGIVVPDEIYKTRDYYKL